MDDDFCMFKNKAIVIMCVCVVGVSMINCFMLLYMMCSLARIDSTLTTITATQTVNSVKTTNLLDKILKR